MASKYCSSSPFGAKDEAQRKVKAQRKVEREAAERKAAAAQCSDRPYVDPRWTDEAYDADESPDGLDSFGELPAPRVRRNLGSWLAGQRPLVQVGMVALASALVGAIVARVTA